MARALAPPGAALRGSRQPLPWMRGPGGPPSTGPFPGTARQVGCWPRGEGEAWLRGTLCSPTSRSRGPPSVPSMVAPRIAPGSLHPLLPNHGVSTSAQLSPTVGLGIQEEGPGLLRPHPPTMGSGAAARDPGGKRARLAAHREPLLGKNTRLRGP